MNAIFKVFTTRELAVIIWIVIFMLIFSLDKKVRLAFKNLLNHFFVKTILLSVFALTLYVGITIFILSKIGLWNQSLLKDTLIWFLTVAFIMQMNALKIKDRHYFKDIVKDSLKWTLVIEFIVSIYTFSLLTEIILVPIFIILGAIQGKSMTDKKYEGVQKPLSYLIDILIFAIFVVTIYKTIENWGGLVTISNVNSFIHPIVMTILYIPFIYGYAVYMKYNELFVLADHFAKDKSKGREIKKQIFWTARFNLWTLWTIRLSLYKVDFGQDNLKGAVVKLLQ